MKGLVICAVGLCSVLSTGTVRAEAAHRVVVEPFLGMGGQKFRQQTISALVQLGEKVIPDQTVAITADRLGIRQLSDNYAGLAKDLDATLFVDGAIGKSRQLYVAQLKVTSSSGVLVGRATWNGRSVAALLPKIQKSILRGLKPILARQPASEPSAASSQLLSLASEAAAPASDPLAAGGVASAAPAAEESAAAEQVRAVEQAPSDGESPPGLVAAAEARRALRPNRLDLAVGTLIYQRVFAYAQNRAGPQTNYQILGVPAANFSLDYFPVSFAGVALTGEYSFPLPSRDTDGRPFKTGSFGYSVGAKLRTTLAGIALMAGGAFGEHTFTIAKDDTPQSPQVADVVYRQIKAGLSTRIPVSRAFSVIAGGNYLYLLGVGQLQAYFPYVTGQGGEGYAGVAMRVLPRLEVRGTANMRAYVFAMNSIPADARDARGAIDRYIGLNLSVAIRD
jgi:hypothetical protein